MLTFLNLLLIIDVFLSTLKVCVSLITVGAVVFRFLNAMNPLMSISLSNVDFISYSLSKAFFILKFFAIVFIFYLTRYPLI